MDPFMAFEPVLSGPIPERGVLEVLREIEALRVTGKIEFVVAEGAGEVTLIAGQIAMDQDPLPTGADSVEVFLAARSGTYAVHAVLPALPVSQGDDRERRGSLAVHVPADLMSYCEHAGLTGLLEMRNDGRVVEILYEAGEMLAICLDGRADADLDEVFAWDQGAFRILTRAGDDVRARLPPPPGETAPREPDDPSEREPTVRFERALVPPQVPPGRVAEVRDAAPRPEDTGRHFLRVVEMALTEVVSVREKARASARSAPPPRVRSSEWPLARPGRKDPTVRIVWVGGEPTLEPSGRSAPPRAASLESKAPEAAAKAPEAAAKAPEAAAKAPEAAAKAPEAAAKAPEAAKSSDTPASPSERRPRGLADADEGSTTALVLAVGFLAVVLLIGFLLTR
jgi:hypothetical protein